MFTELLAETDIPAQGVLFIIVMIFSFLKWLFGKLIAKKEEDDSDIFESLYEESREDIVQRQKQISPPSIKKPTVTRPLEKPSSPPKLPQQIQQPRYSSADIEKAGKSTTKKLPLTIGDPIKSKTIGESDSSVIRKKIRSKDGLRQAIIARQILGPPKTLAEH
ncbi:MAG: hypothetical protein ABGY95_08455 [Rubritalea sp.]|uniref:hypothetical protein n=1 Tax=Rubritalea sp. TaxID=2109375 RepID=UPI0032424228